MNPRSSSPKILAFKQGGASALEVTVVITPILLLCLLFFELVQAHQVKQLALLALQEAGRTASVTAAEPRRINQSFEQALLPIFTPAGGYTEAARRRDAAVARSQRLFGLPLWRLELRRLDVRSLELELTYLHEPLQAWLRALLQQVGRWSGSSVSTLTQQARRKGLIPLRVTHQVVIHTVAPQGKLIDLKSGHEAMKEKHVNPKQLTDHTPPSNTIHPFKPATQQPTLYPQANSNRLTREPSGSQPFVRTESSAELCGVLLCCLP